LIATIGALAVCSLAAAAPCPPVTVRNPDGNYIVPGAKGNIPYRGELAFDAYIQRGGARRPSIVVIHGGGWTSGSRAAHVGQLLELATRAGYHWFSLDYRLGGLGRYEEALDDIRHALDFIRCNAAALGIDPGQLVLLGEDSGAHLAALLAAEGPAGVIGGVLIGGFYDLTVSPAVASGLPVSALAAASATTRDLSAMPPLLVVHGGEDREAPARQGQRYCREVAAAANRCTFVEVPGAGHRSENWWPSQWTYKRDVERFLSTLARAPVPAHRPVAGAVEKNVVNSPATRLQMDVYRPPSKVPVPVVIVVHGGGWEAGDKVTYVTPLFEPLARAGLAWVSIDYRLTPAVAHAEQLEDVRQAIRFVRAAHRRLNIDPGRIFLLGESASGQMVTLMAGDIPELAGVISFYGVYDFPAMVTDASPRSLLVRLFRHPRLDGDAQEIMRQYSPLYQARPGLPPLLLVTGTADGLWRQAEAYTARLVELGAAHDTIALPGAPHGLENWEGHPEWMSYKARLTGWIWRIAGAAR
jgi:alpha-L-fucosidase 2